MGARAWALVRLAIGGWLIWQSSPTLGVLLSVLLGVSAVLWALWVLKIL